MRPSQIVCLVMGYLFAFGFGISVERKSPHDLDWFLVVFYAAIILASLIGVLL